MTEYRVKFDFVVHLTNGGSLSAQGFRLDIPGSDIADDELAAYLIQDMRLLMAGQVDITNKQILEEPHKRAASPTAGLPQAMSQEIYLIRHGETEWSRSGRHTGLSDIPLTEHGRQQARLLAHELAARNFQLVLTSPLGRARETCELAGLAERAEIDADLMEWNYGDYEGLTSDEIHTNRPAWTVFSDGGGPGGETPEQVGVRVDRVLARVRAVRGDAALFAHGHVLRVLAARWLGLAPRAGAQFLLDTGAVCVLSSYSGIAALQRWNVSPVVESGA